MWPWSSRDTRADPTGLPPEHLDIGAYREVFATIDVPRYVAVSLGVALAIAVIQVGLAVPAGYALAKLRFVGRRFALGVVLACLRSLAHRHGGQCRSLRARSRALRNGTKPPRPRRGRQVTRFHSLLRLATGRRRPLERRSARTSKLHDPRIDQTTDRAKRFGTGHRRELDDRVQIDRAVHERQQEPGAVIERKPF